MLRLALAVLLAVPVLSGCFAGAQDWLYKDYRPAALADPSSGKKTPDDSGSFASLVSALESAGDLDRGCFSPPAAWANGGTVPRTPLRATSGAQTRAAVPPGPLTLNACVQQRNLIVAILVAKSNDACQAHKATMFGNEASWNIALGTLTNAFTGTAAVVGGPVGKSIFSALGLFSNAERSLVNEEVYRNMLVPAIGQKIDEIRATKLADINGKVKEDTELRSYPMYLALSDVMEYHNDCSFMLGLQTALKEGTGGVSSQAATLRRAEQSIKAQLDSRGQQLSAGKDNVDVAALLKSDPLGKKLQERLDNVEDQLKVMDTLHVSPAGSGT